MSNALLDYSSWSFQLSVVLVILYLVVGLIRPSWVLAAKRRTNVIVSMVILLLAGTAFYIAVRAFDSLPDGSSALNTEGGTATPQP
jgi:nitrate reductase gamma subunit